MKEYSRQTEKDVLSGILNHPEQLIRHKKILNKELFKIVDHRKIFDVIITSLEEDRKIDPVTISNKLDAFNFKDGKGRNLSDYVKSIAYDTPLSESIPELIYQLVDLSYRRHAKETLSYLTGILSSDDSLPEVHNKINQIFAEKIRIPVSNEEKPLKLWEGYIEALEEKAANPEEHLEEIGYDWPYSTLNNI